MQQQLEQRKEALLRQVNKIREMGQGVQNAIEKQNKIKILEHFKNRRQQVQLEKANNLNNQNPLQDRIFSLKQLQPQFRSPFLFQVPPAMQNNQQQVQEAEQQVEPQFQQIQFQRKAYTIEICSACNEQKEQNHQCQGEYGFILCPYCGENIVRNFMKDHQEDCIPYLEHQFTNMEKVEECSICCETITENEVNLQCNHVFHKDCILNWKEKKNECPNCRQLINY